MNALNMYARSESQFWIERLFTGENEERPRFEQLIRPHYEEMATAKDINRLNVNWGAYAQLAKNNFLTMCTVRGLPEDGAMLGYFLCVLMPQPHYQDVLVAVEDSHFILPQYRSLGAGKALFAAMEKTNKDRGAVMGKVRTKKHSDNGDFLKKLGYVHIEDVYQKVY